MFRRLLFGTLSRAAFSLISVLVTLLLVPFLIRALGPETYGLVVLLGIFTAQGFGGLADLGFASAVTKYCAEYDSGQEREKLTRLLGTSFLLYLAIGCATGLIVWVLGRIAVDYLFTVAPADVQVAGPVLVILAIGTVVDFAALWLAAVMDGFQRYHVSNAIGIGRVLVTAALVVGAVHATFSAIGWVAAVVAANLLAVAASYAYLRWMSGWSVRRATFDRAMLRTMWSLSAKVFIIRLTGVAYHTVGRTALGIFRPVGALAVYDVCNKIHAVAIMPMGFTSPLTIPAVSSLDATGRAKDLGEFFLRGTLYTVALSLPVAVILIVLAPHVLSLWIGRGFEAYATEARVFLSYVLLWSLTPVGWNIMIGLNRTETLLPVNLVSVGLNITISLALASRLGVLGVILGTVIGNLVAVPWYLKVFLNQLGVRLGDFLRRVVLRAYPQAAAVGLGLAVVAHFHPPGSVLSLGVLAATAGALYLALFWFTGVDAVDKRRFAAVFTRTPRTGP